MYVCMCMWGCINARDVSGTVILYWKSAASRAPASSSRQLSIPVILLSQHSSNGSLSGKGGVCEQEKTVKGYPIVVEALFTEIWN